jgi:hypothetical protein
LAWRCGTSSGLSVALLSLMASFSGLCLQYFGSHDSLGPNRQAYRILAGHWDFSIRSNYRRPLRGVVEPHRYHCEHLLRHLPRHFVLLVFPSQSQSVQPPVGPKRRVHICPCGPQQQSRNASLLGGSWWVCHDTY